MLPYELLQLIQSHSNNLLLNLIVPRFLLTPLPFRHHRMQLLQSTDINSYIFIRQFRKYPLRIEISMPFNAQQSNYSKELQFANGIFVDDFEVGEELGKRDADGL